MTFVYYMGDKIFMTKEVGVNKSIKFVPIAKFPSNKK